LKREIDTTPDPVSPGHYLNRELSWLEFNWRVLDEALGKSNPLLERLKFFCIVSSNLDIIVQLEKPTAGQPLRHLAVVQVPRVLPSLIKLPRVSSRRDYIFLAHLVGHFLADLFPGTRILGYWQFRITRNSELYIDEEEMPNLLKAVEHELHNRRKGDVVRLEIEQHCPLAIRQALLGTFRLGEADLYVIDGPLNPTRLLAICEGDHSPELRDPPFLAPVLRDQPDLFAAIRQRDILLHHPYDSFSSVVAFVEKAAEDPRVLAIKQTLYRTGGDRQIVGALMNAVRNGEQVTAVVELRARFDEEDNIVWARQLEEAGVHVVYGLVGYKIHAKMCLVVRRDNDGIRRYLHLGTSNYNPNTARLYTDLGLFTCRPDFGEDATNLFNLLTGICQYQGMRKLLIAPFELHSKVLDLIGRETANARAGLPARIIAKLNSLVDEQVIQALYTASQAGVTVELIVRGICCLRPGVKGLSSNITVRSIVDRFLEHSRIYYFENAYQPEVFMASADWMPRNFFRRLGQVGTATGFLRQTKNTWKGLNEPGPPASYLRERSQIKASSARTPTTAAPTASQTLESLRLASPPDSADGTAGA
jgi:polyphosphate kinase